MLPMQTPDPNINGMSIGDFIGETFDNIIEGEWQTVWALVGMVIVMGLAFGAKLKPYIAIPMGIGGFYAGWLAYNTFTAGLDNPLFPGQFQANQIWDVVTNDPLAATFVLLALAVVWMTTRGAKLLAKIVLFFGTLFLAAIIYNLLQGWNSVSV